MPSPRSNKKGDDPKRPRRKRARVVAIVLGVLVAIGVAAAAFFLLRGHLPSASSGPAGGGTAAEAPSTEMGGAFASVDASGVQLVATDEDEAREAIQAAAAALSIEDAGRDLGPAEIAEVDGNAVYRFGQQANDIPVYGRSVSVATDSSGNVTAMTGNAVAVETDVTEPQVPADEARSSVEAYIADNNAGATDVSVSDPEDGALVYYTFGESPVLAWRLAAVYSLDGAPHPLEVIVSAEDGSVLLAQEADADVTMEGSDGKQVDVSIDDYSGTDSPVPMQSTVFGTEEDGTTIYTYEPDESWLANPLLYGFAPKYWEGRDVSQDDRYKDADPVMSNETTDAARQAASSIDTFTEALHFYDQVLNRESYDGEGADVYVFVGATWLNGDAYSDNAAWWGVADAFFCAAKDGDGNINPYFADAGVSGHEFTHAVVDHTAGLFQTDANGRNMQSRSINEGIADIEGVAIRAAARDDQNASVDWRMAGRDITNPGNSKSKSQVTDYGDFMDADEASGVEEHDGSTVVSHAGYLIWKSWTQGGDATDRAYTDLLAQLYYQALLLMPSDCTVAQSAECVLAAGRTMVSSGDLTTSQYHAIEEAFGEMGYPAGTSQIFLVLEDAELVVNDINGNPYGNYHVAFSCLKEDAERPADMDVVVDEQGPAGKVPLPLDGDDFERGLVYALTVSDLGGSGAEPTSKRIMFLEKNEGPLTPEPTVEIPTQLIEIDTIFGNPTPPSSTAGADLERDVVLVLDVSGSMNGEPLESLRAAVNEFIDLAEENGIHVGIAAFSSETQTFGSLEGETDYDGLRTAVASSEFFSAGGTNMESGVSEAVAMLDEGSGDVQTIVVMSDGQPNEGATGEDLVDEASRIKSDGTVIYTVGFFSSLNGDSLIEAQDLLERMATPGEHFEATGDNLDAFFSDIASQVSGQLYTYARITGNVDVTVVRDGEVLSSVAPDVTSNTSFGSISYMAAGADGDESSASSDGDGSDTADTVKTVRLRQGEDYDIHLTGTGSGEMDYSISFMDENGEYGDERSFTGVDVEKGTVVGTSSAHVAITSLEVDEDGDGSVDVRYRATAGEKAERTERGGNLALRVAICAAGVVAVGGVVGALEYRSRKRSC